MSEEIQPVSKPWYASKTIWVNVLLGVGVVVAGTLKFTVSPEETAAIITLANLVLRALSKDKITIS
jgi:hypothetical protein